MYRYTVSHCDIADDRISWNGLAAFCELDQNIINSLYNNTAFQFFLADTTDQFVEQRFVFTIKFGLGFEFSDDLQRGDF